MAKAASYLNATGIIRYNMTNDYMFRYILQKNQKVLKGLICSLLNLKPEEIKSITIKNPINLNEDLSAKEFVLDIEILLNDDTNLNLEMHSFTSVFLTTHFSQTPQNSTPNTNL